MFAEQLIKFEDSIFKNKILQNISKDSSISFTKKIGF
jgi:hypothetical protein